MSKERTVRNALVLGTCFYMSFSYITCIVFVAYRRKYQVGSLSDRVAERLARGKHPPSENSKNCFLLINYQIKFASTFYIPGEPSVVHVKVILHEFRDAELIPAVFEEHTCSSYQR